VNNESGESVSKYSDRYGMSKSLAMAIRALSDAEMLFSVMDDLLIESGDHPVLPENRQHVNAQFAGIWQKVTEIKITLAEDKHGRIRHVR
jgi:hypothetical protein